MLSRHRACALQAASTPWSCSKGPGAVLAHGPGILNSNWFEERLRPTNVPLDPKRARRRDPEFVHNEKDAVVRLSRAPHHVSYAWPDDGYRQWQTTSMADFKAPEQKRRESGAIAHNKSSLRDAWSAAQGASELKSFGPVQSSRSPARCSSWSTTSKDFYSYASREAASPCSDSLVDQQREEQARCAFSIRARRDATDIASLGPEMRARQKYLAETPSEQHQRLLGDSPQAQAPGIDARESRPWGAGAGVTPEWQEYLADRSGYLYCPSTRITRSASAARRKGLTFQDD